MPSGIEVAQAYITIIPSMKGIQGDIAKQLNADVVGKKAGKELGSGMEKGAKSSGDALMKSFGSVGDRIAFKTKTGLSTAFQNVADGAKKRMSGVAATIGDKFKAVGAAIGSTGIGKALAGVATTGAAAFTKITGTVKGVAQFVGEAFKGVAGKVQSFLAPIAGKAAEVFGKVSSAAQGAFSGMVKAASVGAATVVAAVGSIATASINSYSEYQQLAGGAEKIFSGMDYEKWSSDAQNAYKTMGMSANEYLTAINQTGAAFKATMGTEAGYDTAKRGMQAIADYASGTGRNIDELNEKYALITRSTGSYQSIADQFSGLLPATSADFLEQAQAAGLLSTEYEKLTDVPIAEYQQAVTSMMEKGNESLGLTGNTAKEAYGTISGSMGMLKSSWSNFLVEMGKNEPDVKARVSELVDAGIAVIENVAPRVTQVIGELFKTVPPAIMEQVPKIKAALTDLLDGVTGGKFSEMVALLTPYAERIGAAAQGMIERFKPLQPVVESIGDKLGGILLTGIDAATGAFEFLAPIVSAIAETALPALDDALGVVGDAFSAALEFMQPVGDFLSETLAGAIDWVSDKLGELADWVSEKFGIISDAASSAAEFMNDPLGSLGKLADKAGEALTNNASSAEKSSKRVKNTGRNYTDLSKTIGTSMSGAESNASRSMEKLNRSVTSQTKGAADASDKNAGRIKKSWDKSYTTKLTASANTSNAESSMRSFKSRWSGFSVNGKAGVDTSSAVNAIRGVIDRFSGFTINLKAAVSGVAGKLGMASGGIVHRHADGFIANRPGAGVDVTHIVGEAGAEAVIPLTNKRYVRPFAQTVADLINEHLGGNVYVNGTVNDAPAIREVTKSYLLELARLGAI